MIFKKHLKKMEVFEKIVIKEGIIYSPM